MAQPVVGKICDWGTALLVFLLPWQARWIARVGERPLTGTPLEWLTLSLFATEVLVATLVVIAMFDRDFRTRVGRYVDRRVLVLALTLVVLAALSVFWSHNRDVAIQKAATLALASGAFVLMVGARRPILLIRAFVASISLQAAVGIAQTIHNFSPASTWLGIAEHSAFAGGASVVEWAGGRLLRAYGTLPHPNVLGGFFALAIMIGLNVFLRTSKPRSRVFLTVSLALLTLGLLLTFSRSAWLAVAVGLLPIFIRERRRVWAERRSLVLAVVPALVVAFVFWSAVVGRVTGQGRLENRSTAERVSSWRDGLDVFVGHPFLGVGAGQLNPDVYVSSAISTEPTHFVPLQVAVELGTIGLLSALTLWYLVFMTAKKSAVALGVFLALSTVAALDHYLWTLWAGNLLLIFGIAQVFLSCPTSDVGQMD